MATNKQIEYMKILFNELGYDTRIRQLDYCRARIYQPEKGEIKYLDDLSVKEASRIVDSLKDERSKWSGEGEIRNRPSFSSLIRREAKIWKLATPFPAIQKTWSDLSLKVRVLTSTISIWLV